MPAKLFVGNLSFQATEEDLRELFQQAGTVESVRIVTDQFTGRPRGFGFVEMSSKEEASKAVEMLNGRLFRDRNLVVDEARPQAQRGAGGPRGDRGPRPGGAGAGGDSTAAAPADLPAARQRSPAGVRQRRGHEQERRAEHRPVEGRRQHLTNRVEPSGQGTNRIGHEDPQREQDAGPTHTPRGPRETSHRDAVLPLGDEGTPHDHQ